MLAVLTCALAAGAGAAATAGATTTHRYWVALQGVQTTNWWMDSGDACGSSIKQEGAQSVRLEAGVLLDVSSDEGVALPWFSRVVQSEGADGAFPRMVWRTIDPVQISGTPCPGSVPQSGACAGGPSTPGCVGTALPNDCGWRTLHSRRVALAPTRREAAAKASRFALGEVLPSVTAPEELRYERCAFMPADGTMRAEIQNAAGRAGPSAVDALKKGLAARVRIEGDGTPRGAAGVRWLTSWSWRLTFRPCPRSGCAAPIPDDPRLLPENLELRLTNPKASPAVVFVGIRTRARVRTGQVALYGLHAGGGLGARVGGGSFRMPARARRTRVRLGLLASARAELMRTGELPVVAIVREDGRATVRRQLLLRTPVPPTIVAGPSGPQAGSATTAELRGGIVGHARPVTYHFEYGPTPAYGQRTPARTVDQEGIAAFAVVEELTPAATYHFRLVATTSGGTAAGPDGTFTMPAAPAPPVEPPVDDGG